MLEAISWFTLHTTSTNMQHSVRIKLITIIIVSETRLLTIMFTSRLTQVLFFFNAISFQMIMALYRSLFLFICELLCLLEKNTRSISYCFLHSLEISIVFLLDWHPLKTREPSQPCYLTHSWRGKNEFILFPKALVHSEYNRLISFTFNTDHY